MINTKELKQRINCIGYAQRIGLPVSRTKPRCASPLRTGATNKTSFYVGENWFCDYGGDAFGDVIDLCAAINHDGDKGKAIRELAELTGMNDDDEYSQNWLAYMQNLANKVQRWHEALNESDKEYLLNRKITNNCIETLKIGAFVEGGERRIVIPYWSNNHPVYYISRGSNPKYKKCQLDNYNEHVIFGLDTLKRDKDTLVITEGCFDLLSFWQEDYCVVGTMGGYFNKMQLNTLKDICTNFKKIILCFDNDSAGRKFTKRMSQFLFRNHVKFYVADIPKDYGKDVSDYYCKGGNLSELIRKARFGLAYMTSQYETESEFEEFVLGCRKYTSKTDYALIFNEVQDRFNNQWLKELKKICLSAPSEKDIADEIVSEHILLYAPAQGFLEYTGTHYDRVTDDQIKSYITKNFGIYATGSRVNGTLNLVKALCVTSFEFNSASIVNFANGTLDLKTMQLRKHSASDLITYCLDYEYQPKVKSEKWIQFIEDITDGNQEKADLLQEYCGYILFPDNRFQQCLCLIGEGSNGKSVFCKIMQKVFPNTTDIEMHDLAKDFNSIRLMDSMLNIAAETKSSVVGAEERFKQVIDGSSISDSFKGKDKISFIPRAKWIIAANHFVKGKDLSEGWMRRFIMMRFTVSFVDNPTRPNEKKKNKNLEKELSSKHELTGIFNWLLEGYVRLNKNGKFTKTEESLKLRDEYIEEVNPVVVFTKELQLDEGEFISNFDLYEEYKEWANRNNHKTISSRTFHKRFKDACGKYRPNVVVKRKSNDRGYERVKSTLQGLF